MSESSGDTVSKYGDGTYSGRVKWFNRTQGWGFITITGEDFSGDDVFVYWNSLDVGKEQYRYLVNGEYVTFGISWNKDAKHPYQATNVKGAQGGQLMCETRNEQFKSKTYDTQDGGTRAPQPRSRGRHPPRPTGFRNRHMSRQTYNVDENGNKWVLVTPRANNRRTNNNRNQPRPQQEFTPEQ